ncbi:hypothetical protein FQR65_LT15918 [Abscondita terminalis]|nr:hypothetical protein FQR65_LT15918 [Abscondita terminalis]
MPVSSSSCNNDRNSKSQKPCCDDQQKHHETKNCDQKCSNQICHIPAKLFDIGNSVFWKNDMSIFSVVLSIWQPPRLGKAVTAGAANLKSAIAAIKMGELQPKEHDVWMMVMKDLEKQTAALHSSKGLEKQRIVFMSLSEQIYKLIKATDPAYTVYYNHCPMFNDGKGANWLSKEKSIQNPYYGSQMLTCGSIKETIK